MTIFLAALSALSFGLGDFAGGFAARSSRILAVLAVSQTTGSLLALAGILILGQPFPAVADILWSLGAGLSGLVGLMVLYRGIATSLVAVVSPVSALMSAALPLAFGLLRGERPAALALAGAALCLPAVLLLGWERSGTTSAARLRAALGYGLLSGAGFGGFFIGLSLTGADSGFWPVFAARTISLLVVLALLFLGKGDRRLKPRSLPWSLGAGAADMGGNILFLLASRSGLLSLVSVISSLFPAPTVLLARIVLKERIPPIRVAGFALAIAGVALMSLRH